MVAGVVVPLREDLFVELVEFGVDRVQLGKSIVHDVILGIRRLAAKRLKSSWSWPGSAWIGSHQKLDDLAVTPDYLSSINATRFLDILYNNLDLKLAFSFQAFDHFKEFYCLSNEVVAVLVS